MSTEHCQQNKYYGWTACSECGDKICRKLNQRRRHLCPWCSKKVRKKANPNRTRNQAANHRTEHGEAVTATTAATITTDPKQLQCTRTTNQKAKSACFPQSAEEFVYATCVMLDKTGRELTVEYVGKLLRDMDIPLSVINSTVFDYLQEKLCPPQVEERKNLDPTVAQSHQQRHDTLPPPMHAEPIQQRKSPKVSLDTFTAIIRVLRAHEKDCKTLPTWDAFQAIDNDIGTNTKLFKVRILITVYWFAGLSQTDRRVMSVDKLWKQFDFATADEQLQKEYGEANFDRSFNRPVQPHPVVGMLFANSICYEDFYGSPNLF